MRRILNALTRLLAWVLLDPDRRTEPPPGQDEPYRPPRRHRCPLCGTALERDLRGICAGCDLEVAAGD